MAFVNKQTSEEERKNFSVLQWTIDKERDAILIHYGGVGRSDNYSFEFYYKGNRTKFLATLKSGADEHGQEFVSWGIPPLGMPEFPMEEHTYIREMIIEAFHVFGWAGYNYKNLKVTAKFGPNLKIN